MLLPVLFLIVTAAATSLSSVGQEADIEEHWYATSLERDGKHVCEGSVVRPTIILTAASCVHGYPIESLRIRAGTATLGKHGEVRKIRYAYVHPDYDSTTRHNDVAVLELTEQLNFEPYLGPADLIKKDVVVPDDAIGVFPGWGISSSQNAALSKNLKEIRLPRVTDEDCAKAYPDFNSTTMICFGGSDENDACLMSVGGPILVRRLVHIKEQVGILSTGMECRKARKPAVFTKILGVYDFVDEYAWKP